MRKFAPLALGALAFASVAGAQQQAPEMFFVVQDIVSPAHMQAYETASKAFIAEVAMTPQASEVRWTAVSGPEVGYYYVVPIEGWADLGDAFATWEAMGQAMGPKYMEHMMASQAHVEETATMVIMKRPDLSHNPDRAALTPENAYRHYTWWYPLADKTQEAEALAKEYVALFQAKGIADGWATYQIVMGPNQPAYLVVIGAPDQATYNQRDTEITEILGDDGMRLQAKAMSLARRVTMSEGWLRPDLSFPQAAQQMGAK